ncbi:hypothetical protein HJG60_010328 [Phyllostomus discolor]|uniref:Uncharacterized protein n=1 Tax=Phyllostomus discolor TaxID=89673 RepID=A0A834EK93_9CHIR|nr:hypothetical protein HJG60_010328 [Phyllostomus discolor]
MAGSVSLLGEGSGKGQWPLPAFLSGRKLSPSSCLDDRHFSFYMPLAPFKLLSWCWSSEGVSLNKSMCGFLRGTAWDSRSSSTNSVPTGFCSQKLWGLIFLAVEHWAGGPDVELGLLAPEILLPNFYSPHVDVGPAHSASLPLLLV